MGAAVCHPGRPTKTHQQLVDSQSGCAGWGVFIQPGEKSDRTQPRRCTAGCIGGSGIQSPRLYTRQDGRRGCQTALRSGTGQQSPPRAGDRRRCGSRHAGMDTWRAVHLAAAANESPTAVDSPGAWSDQGAGLCSLHLLRVVAQLAGPEPGPGKVPTHDRSRLRNAWDAPAAPGHRR